MKRTSRIWNIAIVICLAIIVVIIIVKCLAHESPVEAESTEVTTTEEVSYTVCTSEPTVSMTEEVTTVEDTTTEDVTTTESVPERYEYEAESVMLAKLVFKEARGLKSVTEQANVIWTVLNRVDRTGSKDPEKIVEVVTKPHQFAWNPDAPTVDDYGRDLVVLANRILLHWAYGDDNSIFRTLPSGYYYFYGDGKHNHFTNDYELFKTWAKTKVFDGEYDYYLGYLPEDG